MERKAFVLLSGGVDSTTCLHQAIYDYAPDLTYGGLSQTEAVTTRIRNRLHVERDEAPIHWVEAISINYGQRHKKEMEYAAKTCAHYGIWHTILDVGKLLSGATVMLTDESRNQVEVPNMSYADIKGVSPTYVPFRNGLMLSALTAHVQKYVNSQIQEQADTYRSALVHDTPTQGDIDAATKDARDLCGIYFGAHAEDAHNWAYPDCTPEFIGAMANAIYTGSYYSIRLHTPLEWLKKDQVVALGTRLGVNWEDTWSCYRGDELHCGVCPTCRSRKEAFITAGVFDPTQYAE